METVYEAAPANPALAPQLELRRTERGIELIARSNGSPACFGGWRMQAPVHGGTGVRFEVVAECVGLEHPAEVAGGVILWAERDEKGELLPWEAWGRRYCDDLLRTVEGPGRIRLGCNVRVPERAEVADIWLFFRWSPHGEVRYINPQLCETALPAPRRARVSLVTGPLSLRDHSIARDLDFHLRLTAPALADNPDFIGYPEVITRGSVPGPETDRVARIAADHRVTIGLPMFEVEGDVTYNSVIFIGPDGEIMGRYRKVHLAYPMEMMRGVTAGNDFPVFDTPCGRIGANICMDSSVPESAMMVAIHGADMLFLPIMGDLRADGRDMGIPVFNMERFLVIMRCRALDTQMHLLVARNSGQGSCIVDPWGDLLALNEGHLDHITAEIALDARRNGWAGSDMRTVMHMQRRPHLYADLAAPHNLL